MDTITFYGHAALGLRLENATLLVDPFFTENPQSAIQAQDASADYILVTHGHFDHLGDTEAIARRTGAQVITGGAIASWLRKKGFDAQSQQIGGGAVYPFGYLKFTTAIHTNALPDGTDAGLACGFVLKTNAGAKIYIAGDTGLFGDMSLIGEEGIDLALLPIGDFYTMGPSDALRAVKLLRPGRVIPYHYNTFDKIKADPLAWKKTVEAETPTRVVVLKPGESTQI